MTLRDSSTRSEGELQNDEADLLSSSDTKTLSKSLLSLRVHLSTAKLSWISAFLDLGGLDAIETQLYKYAFGLKSEGDSIHACLLEAVKCLRAVLNTEVGTWHLSPGTDFSAWLLSGDWQVQDRRQYCTLPGRVIPKAEVSSCRRPLSTLHLVSARRTRARAERDRGR
jgi:hypothetical protein